MSGQKKKGEGKGMTHTNDNDNEITSIDVQLRQVQKDMIIVDSDKSYIRLFTIFKVNVWLHESNPDAYTPKMVSIGPYHRKNPQLIGRMEKYKLLYLGRFLQRRSGLDVKSCINELVGLKDDALKCYEDIKDDGHFCEMLLLDGCFVVEFIREHCEICPKGEGMIINDYNETYIFRDLILLENQLPFFVLNKLHHMTMQDNESPLAILVSKSYSCFFNFPKMNLDEFNIGCTIKHLLHLVHIRSCHENHNKNSKTKDDQTRQSCHGNHNKNSETKDDLTRPIMDMPNATELAEAGVSFAKASDTTRLFDIKFENGLMTIPCFKVEDDMETMLRNLIAYEQQSSDVLLTPFSDFALFMDHLIESDKDVNLLRQKEIIQNWIGEDKEVANLFNKIGKGVTIYPDFYYKEECRKAIEHCKTPCNKMMANLLRNYFSSPWVGASTVAAIILLVLTIIQTILAFTGSIN